MFDSYPSRRVSFWPSLEFPLGFPLSFPLGFPCIGPVASRWLWFFFFPSKPTHLPADIPAGTVFLRNNFIARILYSCALLFFITAVHSIDKFTRVPMALPASAQPSSVLLESLPVEIQVHILKSLPDIKTLGSLLRASPQYLRVHLDVREDIISHIVCNQITPAILPLAIDVFQQSYLRSHRRPRSKVLEFLETFKEPRSLLP